MQWLLVAGALFGLWLAVVVEAIPFKLNESGYQVIIAMPIYLLMTFACYSLAVVGYRVATFNDCEEASNELKQQIKEAKQDLSKKGFKFSSQI